MLLSITPFVVLMASMSGFVFTQNKEFCESFVDNNYEIDFGFAMFYYFRVFITGRDYWSSHQAYDFNQFNNKSQRLPDWFDSECVTLFCYEDCDPIIGSLGCLKVSQFMSSFMFVYYNESIDFRPKVLRMALMLSNGRRLLLIGQTFCTDLRKTHFLIMNPKSRSKKASHQPSVFIIFSLVATIQVSWIKRRRTPILPNMSFGSDFTDS